MTSYVKIGTEWCISSATQPEPGSTITVTTRAGKEKQVTLDAMVGNYRGNFLFSIATNGDRTLAARWDRRLIAAQAHAEREDA
jgi:hypothetical protein